MLHRDEVPSEDKYGRRKFAEHLALILREIPAESGFIVGLTAPWGNGKTTTLSFLTEILSDAPGITVLNFRPYAFETTASLVSALYTHLSTAIRKRDPATAKKIGTILTTLEAASRVGAGVSTIASLFMPIASLFAAGFAAVASIFSSSKDLGGPDNPATTIEDDIAEAHTLMRDMSGRIVFTIDEVDRLTPLEIQTLFRLIRMMANFPNVTYVVAFDRDMVVDALKPLYSNSAESASRYLEKIFQLEIPLPYPDRGIVKRELIERLNQLTTEYAPRASTSITNEDQARMAQAIDGSLLESFRNLRTVKRFLNQLRVLVPLVDGEVNLVDFLILEGIRVSDPSGHRFIRASLPRILGVGWKDGISSERKIARKAEVETLLSEIYDAVSLPRAVQLVSSLFPQLSTTWGKIGAEEVRALRVCCERFAWRYFNYFVPIDDVSSAQIAELVLRAGDQRLQSGDIDRQIAATAAKGPAAVEKLFDDLSAIAETMPAGTATTLTKALLRNFETLPVSKFDMFLSLQDRCGWLLEKMLGQLPKSNLVQTLQDVIAGEYSVPAIAICLNQFRPVDTRTKNTSLRNEEWLELGQRLSQRLDDEDSKVPLYELEPVGVAGLPYFLMYQHGDQPKLRKRLTERLEQNPRNSAEFILHFVGRTTSGKGIRPSDLSRDTYNQLATFCDSDVLAAALRAHFSLTTSEAEYPHSDHSTEEEDWSGEVQARQFLWHKDHPSERSDNGHPTDSSDH